MAEPTITCPYCHRDIRLTESLAAPLVEATRRDYEERLAGKDAEMAEREQALATRAHALAEAEEAVDAEVGRRLAAERARIAADEAKKAQRAAATDLAAREQQIADLEEVLRERDAKLGLAQKTQIEMLRKQRELDDARRALELTVEERVRAGLEATRARARKEAEERLSLQVAERDETIAAMKRQLEELQRRADLGSPQLAGEVLELALEGVLRAKFPGDTIAPVPKGEFGGDVLQQVAGPQGQPCGTILWESKRTQRWSDAWLGKLRSDQRTAKAELCAIVSQALPKGIDTFDWVDGVWVVHPRAVEPVAVALRQSLIEVAAARKAMEGQQGKMEMVYRYLTGTLFRQRVQAIVEAFTLMREDLEREKKALRAQWAKREQQITQVMEATAGMYGDLHGIAGRSLAEVEGLELKALGAPGPDEGTE
jgi:hypothetical protein